MQNQQVIVICVRRWFHKGPGNTYHSVAVYLPDGTVVVQGQTYGYGTQYESTAFRLIAGTNNEGRNLAVPWQWYKEHNYLVHYDVVDVPRQMDLHSES